MPTYVGIIGFHQSIIGAYIGIITAKIGYHWWVNVNQGLVGVNCKLSTCIFFYK